MADVSQTTSTSTSESHKSDASVESEVCSNGESKDKNTPLTSSRTFVLNPPRLSNPFARKDPEKTEDDTNENKNENKEESIDTFDSANNKVTKTEVSKIVVTSPSKVSFVPLGGEPSTSSTTSTAGTAATAAQSTFSQQSSSPALGFVFGQNIHEKVETTISAITTTASSETTNAVNSEPVPSTVESTSVTTNGTTSEMLFSTGVKKETQPGKHMPSGGKSLSEAAREYEEARAVKRKFEAVQVITGEEEESNVLQINCKLFSWSSCSWVERGRGTLRVNDLPTNPPSHRLIVRAAGSLRLVLNTKIWSEMTVDRASVKSMRITGMDNNGVVKVFLLMASPKEMDQLQKCLEWRVNNLKKSEETLIKKSKNEELDDAAS